jgi:iron complex outermembrane receptor protein
MKLSDRFSRQRALVATVAATVSGLAALPLYAADQAAGGIEEVVVTAQFREQKLQDTPIAITAVTSETLEARNQNNLATLANQAPNVNLRETGGAFGPGMSASIRGIGQADFDPALEPGVGVYIDDVYYSSLTGSNFDLLDLDRVEIARGPQGVLGGRNSEGGSIRLFSTKPKGDGSGSLRATYGSRNLLDIRAVGDFALTDSLAVRVSGVNKKQDGYVQRLDFGCLYPASGVPTQQQMADCKMGTEGGKDYSAGRVAARWQANDSFEVNFSADMTVDNSETAAVTLLQTNTSASGAAAIAAAGSPLNTAFVPSDPFVSYATYQTKGADGRLVSWAPVTRTKIWGMNLSLDWKLSDTLALKSITAYRRFDSRWVEDNDASPAYGSLGAEHLYNHSFSQELRLNGSVATVDYTVGGYYFDQVTTYPTHQILTYAGNLEFLGNDPVSASTYAAFANGSWHITDALNLNVGARYTKEKKDYTYSRLNTNGTPHAFLGALTGQVGHYEGSKVDYRVNLDYRWNEQLMTYASVSTGFKGGGTNPRPFFATQVQPFDKENVTAYEIGAKSDFLNRKVRVNVSAFFNKFKDIQLTRLTCPEFSPPGLGFLCALPTNGGDADIKGIELETELHPVGGLSIDASFSSLNFKYTRTRPDVGIPVGATAPGTIKTKWSAGMQYEFPVVGGATLTPRIDASYQGDFYTNVVTAPSNRVDGYTLANARLTWRSNEGNWEAALLASNLFDKLYYISVFDLLASSGSKYGTPGAPREFSLQVQKKF